MKKQTRRDFLVRSIQLGLTAATVNAFLPGWALADGTRAKRGKRVAGRGTLVVIYLRGGIDALNVVVPYTDPTYYEYRPGIGIAPKDQGQEKGVIPLNKVMGLHPALEPLYPLYERKQLAPMINVGSPHPSRSHFDCMDFMEYAAPGERTVKNGWLNRYLNETLLPDEKSPDVFRAVAVQGLLPRSLRGRYPVLAVPRLAEGGDRDPLAAFDEVYEGVDMLGEDDAMEGADPDEHEKPKKRFGKKKKDEEEEKPVMETGGPGPDPILIAGRNTIDKIRRYREIVRGGRNDARYPMHPLANRLKELARVIKSDSGLEVAAIDYPGWDHHAREGGSEGRMSNMLGALAGALKAFADDLGPHMERTVVLTMSEFGRTAKENGNLGTDHGHGGVMLALGGPVNGGRIYGQWDGLDEKALNQKRDLPSNTDFRWVFAETLEKVFNFDLPRDFFPKYAVAKNQKLGYLNKVG